MILGRELRNAWLKVVFILISFDHLSNEMRKYRFNTAINDYPTATARHFTDIEKVHRSASIARMPTRRRRASTVRPAPAPYASSFMR